MRWLDSQWLGIGSPSKPTNTRAVEKVASHHDRPRQVSLALGGGGARGIAHLGVMQSIFEAGMQVDRIVGVSMGALAGAMCASGAEIADVQRQAIQWVDSPGFAGSQAEFSETTANDDSAHSRKLSWYSRLRRIWSAQRKLKRAVTSPSLLPNDALRHSIDALLPDCDLRDLKIPLSIVAIDLLSGRRVIIESGSLRKAVLASASIPGIFPPVRWGHRLLADIGLIESIPVGIARSYARDLSVAVDVGQTIQPIKRCDTALDVMMRVDDVCERILRRHLITDADIVIRPNVGDVPWFDFSDPVSLIQQGHAAATQAWKNLAGLRKLDFS